MDLLKDSLPVLVSAVVGAVALYVLQRIPVVWGALRDGITRVGNAVNHIRKFVLARKATRLEARSAFMSRRNSVSLVLLELTLFRWYDKHGGLLPYVKHVQEKHKNERVRRTAYNLLWDDKPAAELKVGDIVDNRDGARGHVLHIRHDEDATRVLWHAIHESTSDRAFPTDGSVRVTRGGWCPLDDCRYCDMAPSIRTEIGDWWWRLKEAQKEANRLRRGGENYMVSNVEDADSALHGIADYELVRAAGGKAMQAPDHYDYGPITSAQSVAELKTLAREGWQFQILRCPGYDNLPPVIISNWRPPQPP